MIIMLKDNRDKTFDIVSETEVVIGDSFDVRMNAETKTVTTATVNKILEQRKERGVYFDESKRRFWARVSE